MSILTIPKWLIKRRIEENDSKELVALGNDQEAYHFGDITSKTLEVCYGQFSRVSFYKLVRILGFYGATFSGKLSAYTGAQEKQPDLLSVDLQYYHEKISHYADENITIPLSSCSVLTMKQLHGVPVKSILLLAGENLTLEQIESLLPVKIVQAHENFFKIVQISPREYQLTDEVSGSAKVTTSDSDFSFSHNNYTGHEFFAPGKFSVNSDTGKACSLPIESLFLSVRSSNCLRLANISTILELQTKSDNELLSIRNFGRISLREIRKKLNSLPAHLKHANEAILEKDVPEELDVTSCEILANLKTRMSDLVLSVRSRRCLEKNNIKYVWQLAKLSQQDLLKFRNLGRKSIGELRDSVKDLGLKLGMSFTPEQLAKIKNYVIPQKSLSVKECLNRVLKDLSLLALPFLKKRENLVVSRRLFKIGKKETLEAIAQGLFVSRERIRQIEKLAIKKIRQQYIKELRIIRDNVKQQVDSFGGLAYLEDLEINLNGLSAQEQTIVSCLLQIMDEMIVVDWNCQLVSTKGEEWIRSICDKIQENIIQISSDKFFTEQDVAGAVNNVVGSIGITGFNGCKNLIKRFETEKNVNKLDNCLCFGRVTKQDKIIQIFRDSFPQGLDVYKKQGTLLPCLKESNPIVFENASPRAVLARLTDHPDILLWGRGFFIHKDHVSFDELLIEKVVLWIENRFDQGHSRFQVDVPFNTFRSELQGAGVPNPYALYTLIRLQNEKRIGQRKYPTIVDLDADVDIQEGILVELESYFLDGHGPIPYSQIQEEFLVKRGWKVYSLQQNINTHSEFIFPWQGNSYIHLEYMNVNYGKLDKLLEALRTKLTVIQNAYSLKGAKKVLSVLWEQVCPSASVRTMIKLIRSVDPEDLQIVNHIIQFTDHSTESSSAAGELETFFLDKGVELNSYELREEFCGHRGWSENRLYGAFRKARLFRSGKSTYLHPTTIGWSESLSQEVHLVLEAHLAERNKNHYPHMQIGELIDEYVLPVLPQDIQWTRQLLISVGEDIGDFLFFDDAYVAQNNSFDIEDMDDMVGYLIARNFKLDIAKKEKVEELLWREGVLESGHSLPSNLFFEESSIKFREESNEVELSPIGISRYAKQV